MTLDLVRRSTKGSPLTAQDHDGNLDKLEDAIEAIDPTDFATAAQGALADTSVQPGDPALTDAREWTASTISQEEAEAGTATTRRAFTAQRVFQAVAAWWAASAAKTKLDGIAEGAEANVNADWDASSGDAAILNKPTLGSAAAASTGDFATAAQGGLADTAVQPSDLATVATSGAYSDLSGTPGLVSSSTAGLMRPVDLGDVIALACSDETTDLTTGTARVTFRMPWAATLTDVRLSVNTAPTGSALIVDVNEGGVSVFGTLPQIDDGDTTSVGSTVTPVISDSALAADAEITVDIDQVGSTTTGKGLKVALYVTRVQA